MAREFAALELRHRPLPQVNLIPRLLNSPRERNPLPGPDQLEGGGLSRAQLVSLEQPV